MNVYEVFFADDIDSIDDCIVADSAEEAAEKYVDDSEEFCLLDVEEETYVMVRKTGADKFTRFLVKVCPSIIYKAKECKDEQPK